MNRFPIRQHQSVNRKNVKKLNSNRHATVRAAALGLFSLALARAPAARAEDKMTAQSLIDRQLILDQITRYYYNFGKVERRAKRAFMPRTAS